MAFGKRDEAKKEAPAETSKEVATTERKSNQAPAFLQGREQSGAGASTKREDNQVPMVYILQSNSPQVNKRGADCVEGAEPGHIWLKNSSRPIVSGEEGFEFQPCAFITKFVEWVHRDDGGGFVAAYDEMPKEAKEVPDRKDPKKKVWAMPNDAGVVNSNCNYVKETKYYTGFARFNGLEVPYVIPMSSSFLTPSKQWMGLITSKMNDRGVIFDIWTSWYRVTTKLRKKGDNAWFVPQVHDVGFIETEQEDLRGRALHEAVMSGERTIDHSAVGAAGGEDEPSGQNDRM